MSARRALDLLAEGNLAMGPEWEAAHGLCQAREGDRDHDLVHALCHWIEGDMVNRNWWYARLGGWTRAETIAAEWQAISDTLSQQR